MMNYIKDKLGSILIFIFGYSLILLFLFCFNISPLLIIYISVILFVTVFIIVILDFVKKEMFYRNVMKSLDNLDKKYYISEIIKEPNFYEGKQLTEILYDVDKSYIEQLNKYKHSFNEFKEYLELWCHEIKTPIATSKLIVNNNKNKVTMSLDEEIDKINDYVEQVLYYAKGEVVEKDYIISDTNIKDIVNTVIKKNKKDILEKKIKINVSMDDILVKSDTKWLTYIINQIINNSIKYTNSLIDINYKINKDNVIIVIKDDGIGIKKEDIPRVFDKGFTGNNGRKIKSSTGMGLYLSKKLTDKLGIKLIVESKENEYTKVLIIFPNSSFVNLT